MGRFGDSWTLAKTSFRVIREEKALLLFPLVSGLCALGIIAGLVVGVFSLAVFTSVSFGTLEAVAVVAGLLAYFVLWIVSVYFSAALIAAATIKLNGGHPTFSDGLRVARGRLGKLVLWAILGGTIVLLIRAISARLKGIAGIIFGLAAGISFAAATYFMIPILLYEEGGTWASIKRSAQVFVQTFGRSVITNLVVGLALAAGFIVGFVLLFAGIFEAVGGSLALGVVLALLGAAVIVFMMILAAAVEGVLVAALYRFASTGSAAPGLVPPQFLAARAGFAPGVAPPPPSSPPLSSG